MPSSVSPGLGYFKMGSQDAYGVTAPKRRDGRRYRGWLDALDIGDSSARDRVIKAIEYHLKKPHQE
jgi:hypothetical protein